ncbi:MAG: helix-turn-helix transcriptional regulator [Deltaproteobacteria bacterium]|nr:helix-turn-helix transcriptional regulator [Deltaproteobacteria bacterium]
MLPFAETVLAWRLARGMTQADLARASGVARPNLSAIERGDREVTLKTLRALAAALNVRPGVLADGCAPNTGAPALTRASLERIAAAATDDNQTLAVPREAALARNLRTTISARIASSTNAKAKGPIMGKDPNRSRQSRTIRGRAADRAYFFLRATEAPEAVASLIERTTGHLARK